MNPVNSLWRKKHPKGHGGILISDKLEMNLNQLNRMENKEYRSYIKDLVQEVTYSTWFQLSTRIKYYVWSLIIRKLCPNVDITYLRRHYFSDKVCTYLKLHEATLSKKRSDKYDLNRKINCAKGKHRWIMTADINGNRVEVCWYCNADQQVEELKREY